MKLKIIQKSTRFNLFRIFCISVFLFMAVFTQYQYSYAQSGDQSSFGIRPTKAYEGKPETSSYFSYDSTPGAVISDEALILNDGQVPVTLKVYAANGITAQNGGTSLVSPDDEGVKTVEQVSKWISLSMNEVTLEPGEQVTVPFTVTVPADAASGQHVGGLMVESVSSESENETTTGDQAQFTVNVVKRVGVAIVVDLPGEHVSSLQVDEIAFETQDENGATFAIKVTNSGNVLTTAEGNLMISDNENTVLSSLPVKVDTILAGDSTLVYLTQPLKLEDGEYLMSVGLIYDGGTAILENVPLKIQDGIATVGGAEELVAEESSGTPQITTIQSSSNSRGGVWNFFKDNQVMMLSILLGLGLLFILVMAGLIWRKRKKEKMQSPHPKNK